MSAFTGWHLPNLIMDIGWGESVYKLEIKTSFKRRQPPLGPPIDETVSKGDVLKLKKIYNKRQWNIKETWKITSSAK